MKRQPKAFISCSLRQQDENFVNLIEKIVREKGFLPFGTVGRYVNESAPVPVTMAKEMHKADCLIVVATPRYKQEDIHNSVINNNALSEMIQVEAGMASMKDIPIIVFVQKGTHVGTFLSASTQYIEIDLENYKESVKSKLILIDSLFDRAAIKINAKWKSISNQKDQDGVNAILQIAGVIGIGSLLVNLFSSNESKTSTKGISQEN